MTQTQTLALEDILKFGVQRNCSDVHLKAGAPPLFRLLRRVIPSHECPTPDP